MIIATTGAVTMTVDLTSSSCVMIETGVTNKVQGFGRQVVQRGDIRHSAVKQNKRKVERFDKCRGFKADRFEIQYQARSIKPFTVCYAPFLQWRPCPKRKGCGVISQAAGQG